MRKDTSNLIVAAIRDFWAEHGFAPTVREIMHLAALSSGSLVQYHLARLREEGRISYESGKARTVRIPKGAQAAAAERLGYSTLLAVANAADRFDASGGLQHGPRCTAIRRGACDCGAQDLLNALGALPTGLLEEKEAEHAGE